MKKIILLFALLSFSFYAHGQNYMIKINGDTLFGDYYGKTIDHVYYTLPPSDNRIRIPASTIGAYVLNGRAYIIGKLPTNYHFADSVIVNKEKPKSEFNFDAPRSASTYLKNSSKYHFIGLGLNIGGILVASIGISKDSPQVYLLGVIIAGIGFGFDLAAWAQIGKAGQAIEQRQLSIVTGTNGVGLALAF